MRLFPHRAGSLPSLVRASVPDRPLSWALSADGTWLVGTRKALVLVHDEEARVVPWETIERADWDTESDRLRVQEIVDFGRPVVVTSFELSEPGALPTLVRERVTASIVVQQRVDLARRRGFTVVGRRSPGSDGPVTWAFELDLGVDPADPAVRAEADAALSEAQRSIGPDASDGRPHRRR